LKKIISLTGNYHEALSDVEAARKFQPIHPEGRKRGNARYLEAFNAVELVQT